MTTTREQIKKIATETINHTKKLVVEAIATVIDKNVKEFRGVKTTPALANKSKSKSKKPKTNVAQKAKKVNENKNSQV